MGAEKGDFGFPGGSMNPVCPFPELAPVLFQEGPRDPVIKRTHPGPFEGEFNK